MKTLLYRWRPWFWLGMDALLLGASLFLAFWLRFDGRIPVQWMQHFGFFFLVSCLVKLPVFGFLGLYRLMWRRIGMREMMRIGLAVALGQGLLGTFYFLTGPAFSDVLAQQFPTLPRSVLLLDGVFTLLLVGGVRSAYRAWQTLQGEWRITQHRRRVLVVGAGNAGAQVVHTVQNELGHMYQVVAFVDDDPGKWGMLLHGVPVYGPRSRLPHLLAELQIHEVWIAMPSAPPAVIRETVHLAKQGGLRHIRIVPSLESLLSGQVRFQDLREVRLEDVLGRDPVRVDTHELEAFLRGKRVLVTGAAGSIGSELCRRILRFRPAALWALDQDETGLFYLAQDLEEQGPTDIPVHTVVADICQPHRIAQAFEKAQPEVVFHAAAYKHVPLMEAHPQEAVWTNVFGTQQVAEAALQVGAQRFVLISTDKAVNPTSVMGATKRVAEQLVQFLNQKALREGRPTRFVAVRFGNVLGSRGSVFPVFQKQIRRGGPVTVTHPDMKRYFMLPSEAALLVLQAGAMGKGGEVFVLDMGKPVRILDLAREMIRLAGFEPDVDIPIVFTGLRPGEKLFEELLTAEEGTDVTKHEKIYVARLQLHHDEATFFQLLEELYTAAREGDDEQIIRLLQRLVPTYRPQRP